MEFTLPLWQVLTTSCELTALIQLPWLKIEIHNCDQFVWLAETNRIILKFTPSECTLDSRNIGIDEKLVVFPRSDHIIERGT